MNYDSMIGWKSVLRLRSLTFFSFHQHGCKPKTYRNQFFSAKRRLWSLAAFRHVQKTAFKTLEISQPDHDMFETFFRPPNNNNNNNNNNNQQINTQTNKQNNNDYGSPTSPGWRPTSWRRCAKNSSPRRWSVEF